MATLEEKLYNAYSSGQMNESEKAQYEADINSGLIGLPPGISLKNSKVPDLMTGPFKSSGTEAKFQSWYKEVSNQYDLNPDPDDPLHFYDYRSAYLAGAKPDKNGHWPSEFKREGHPRLILNGIDTRTGEKVSEDARSNMPGLKIPQILQKFPQKVIEAYRTGKMSEEEKRQFEQDLNALSGIPNIATSFEKKPGELGLVEMITGKERTTPEIEATKDITLMPEMNSLSFDSVVNVLGYFVSDPNEAAKIIKSSNPGVVVTKDAKGNLMLQSAIDGKKYGIKPGFQPSDIPKTLGGMGIYMMTGGKGGPLLQAAKTGIVQTGIEAGQALAGGEFDAEQIPIAAGMEYLGGKAFGKTGAEAGQMAGKKTGAEATKDLVSTTRQAISGKEKALKVLAEEAAPDQKTIQAAERLGIAQYLQPDHVSTNQTYREIAQAIKSIPGSEARAVELKGYEEIGKKADDLIKEFGGTRDLSQLDMTIKGRLNDTIESLEKKSSAIYKKINNKIPPKTEAPATNTIEWIEGQIDELGGIENLTSEEKLLYKRLKPQPELTKTGKVKMKGGKPVYSKQPSYALLDRTRKEIGTGFRKKQGVFKDADSGMLKKLYNLLSDDQQVIAQKLGAGEEFSLAKKTVALRKGVEDDMKAIYGKNLQKSLVGDLSKSVKKLSQGDVTAFNKLLKATPEDMRQELTASGLSSAFGVTAKNGQLSFSSYSKWYEGLLRNKKAYNTLMVNLPKEARKGLSNLYRVSRGIARASKERITTGRSNILSDLQGADNLIKDIYQTSKKAAIYVTARKALRPTGMVGEGLSIGLANILTKGKNNTVRAADKLISSPEFIYLTRNIGDRKEAGAIRRLAKSKPFSAFIKKVAPDLSEKGKIDWIMSSIQVGRQQLTQEEE